jgi:hypothetical protein
MASTISSSSSLTPADSASSVSASVVPEVLDNEHRRIGRKTFRRVYLERLKKPRTGWWWQYGAEWEEIGYEPVKYYWVCAICVSFKPMQTTSTQHIQDHLAKVHRVTDGSRTSLPTVSISEMVVSQRRPISQAERLEQRQKRCRKAILEWITHDRIAFSQVESAYFKEFCASLDEAYETLVPSSHNSIRAWLLTEFTARQANITEELSQSRSSIHLSFDLWTSPHKQMTILSVVAHFLQPDYTNQAILLALRRLEGSHSGENQAELILDTLRTYNIEKIGYFVCDNATSNDTAIQAILRSFGMVKEQERRRLRCLGHIVNLAAQAFLFGRNTEAFETENIEDLEVAYQLWQQAGPVGQIHYLVAFIRASSQRREDFTRLQGDGRGLQPRLDNKTRWNSTWMMLKRAIQLRKALNLFCLQYINSGDLDASVMVLDETWELIEHICSILELFDFATEKLQGAAKDGKHGALWECLPMIEALLMEMEDLKREHPLQNEPAVASSNATRKSRAPHSTSLLSSQNPSTDNFMAIGINNAWLKLNKYYALTDKSEAYVAAVILNPYEKWSFFEASWKTRPDWLSTAKEKVRALWDEYRNSHTEITSRVTTPPPMFKPQDHGRPDYLAKYRQKLYGQEDNSSTTRDEYERYIQPGRVKVPEGKQMHPIRWWQANEGEYPTLAQLAYDLLSIPAMSAENERIFSGTQDLVRDRRCALDVESIQTNECFRNWSRRT